MLWSVRGSHQTILGPPLPNVTRHSAWWQSSVTPSIDQALNQFLTLFLIWTLLPNLIFYRFARGFHRTFATGAACQQRTLTPPDTWSCPTVELASVLMLRLISPELVLPPDFWVSNIPRYFCFCLSLLLLGEYHCWWTSESPRQHAAKFFSRLRLIRSVSRASISSVLKLIEIVNLWIDNTIPFGCCMFWHFWDNTFKLFILLNLAKDHWWAFNAHGPYC